MNNIINQIRLAYELLVLAGKAWRGLRKDANTHDFHFELAVTARSYDEGFGE